MAGSVILAGARTPIGKLSGALGGFSASDLGGFAIKAALERSGVSPDQVDYVFMGHVLQAGDRADHRPPGRGRGRHPHDRARHHRQQGVPVGPQQHLPGRPAHRRRGGRHRGGRRHGVDDPGPVPAAGRPRGLPHGRQVGRRLDDVRRAVLRLRPGGDGRRHREVRGLARPGPRAAGRPGGQVARAGGRRHQGGPAGRRDRGRRGAPAPGRPGRRRHRRGRPARHHGRVARRPAARVRQGRQHHGRQRLADLGRRRGRDRDVEGRGRAPRRRAAGRGRGLRPGRRPRPVAADPAGAGHQGRARQLRAGRRPTSTCSS